MNCEIAHRDVRKLTAGVLRPLPAAVERDPKSELSANEKQILIDEVFLNNVRITSDVTYRRNDLRPRLPIIVSPVNVWPHVAESMRIESRVGGAFAKVPRIDRSHPGIFWQPFDIADDIFPRLATVSGDLHISIVGAGPNQAWILRRFADRKDRGVHLGGRIIDGDAARLFLLLLLRIVGRQIGRDALPRLSVIARAKQKLCANVNRPVLRRAHLYRRVPVIAQLTFLVVRQRLNAARFMRLAIDASDVAAL